MCPLAGAEARRHNLGTFPAAAVTPHTHKHSGLLPHSQHWSTLLEPATSVTERADGRVASPRQARFSPSFDSNPELTRPQASNANCATQAYVVVRYK